MSKDGFGSTEEVWIPYSERERIFLWKSWNYSVAKLRKCSKTSRKQVPRTVFCVWSLLRHLSQDGDLFFGYLKIKMLCTVMLHIKISGLESFIIDMPLLFLFLLEPEL